jgi:protein SCO1
MKARLFAGLLLATCVAAGGALALPGMGPGSQDTDQVPPAGLPGALKEVAFDQRLGETVPLDATFRDENGQTVQLGELLHGRPAILAMVYYECPMLCTLTLNGLASALDVLKLDAGRDFEIITLSFNPRETPELARAKKANYLKRYSRPTAAAGWHFLTGDDTQIHRVTDAAGFRYTWDEQAKQYAHATGLVILTPQGRIARYFYGVEFPPRDLRLGLVEASSGKIGTVVDQALLFCFHYDPATGRYGAAVMRLVRAGGLLTMAGLAVFFWISSRRSRARKMVTVGG